MTHKAGHGKPYRSVENGTELKVTVQPKSAVSEIIGVHNSMLKIKLVKPPADGQANRECCRLLAKKLGIARGRVTIVSGTAVRNKTVLIEGVSTSEVERHLGACLLEDT